MNNGGIYCIKILPGVPGTGPVTASYSDRMAPFTCDDIFLVNIDVFFEGGLSFLDMLLKSITLSSLIIFFYFSVVLSQVAHGAVM